MKLSDADIAEITQFLRDVDFDDLELEWDDIYLRVARRSSLSESAPFNARPRVYAPTGAGDSSHSRTQRRDAELQQDHAAHADTAAPSVSAPSGIVEVRSSLMGTLYRSPQPGDPPFVDVGTAVKAGDTLCLLEVMKVFTALKTDNAGTVERILVSDGDLVQYNQVIMWIRPS
jgi:acetyl-CoA carboxylase biotin carboxyl carrier protein